MTLIAVIGGRNAGPELLDAARETGRLIALRHAALVCGGMGGVMEAASQGARLAGGITVGILPTDDRQQANSYVDIAIATGMGVGRNVIIARSADALIAIGGEYGTLSEIAFALQFGKPVIGIATWDIAGVVKAENAQEAIERAFRSIEELKQ